MYTSIYMCVYPERSTVDLLDRVTNDPPDQSVLHHQHQRSTPP